MFARAAGRTEWKLRSRVIVTLLFASLALVGGLAYQAISAARLQAATARQLLGEYTRLAAEEFTRRASVEVGYYGLYLLGTELRRRAGAGGPAASLEPSALAASPDPQLRRAATLARAVYWLRESGKVPGALGAELARLAREAPAVGQPSAFSVRNIVLDGRRRSIAMLPAGERPGAVSGWLAIEIEDSVLPAWFEAALSRGPMLPATGGGAMPASELYLRVSDPDRSTVFTNGVAADDALMVEREFGGDYGGLFDGYRVAMAINPAAADRLLSGGRPADRVPMLMALLLVAVALLGAAILQVRRERALIETRSDFIARASHELRTPLTQIRMFAETLLLDRVRDPSDRRRFTQIILRESERLGQLVENILHFSRGSRSRMESREALALAPLTREVVADFEPLAAQAGIQLECRLDE